MEIHEKATNQELNFEKLRSSINLCCEVCLWDTSDAMMEPDKKNSYWFFFNSDKDVCGRKGKEDPVDKSDPDRRVWL